MIAIALLPFLCYITFLTSLHFRRTPTVISGSLDFSLLAWGLFGMITLGPGRLIIPLYVFTAWGIFTWIFWFGFYFVVVHVFASRFHGRMVLYHVRRELVLPRFFTLLRDIDPKTEWAGNVLSLYGLGMQWSVSCDSCGAHMLFLPTDSGRNNPHQEIVRQQLTELCRTLVIPKNPIRWVWGFFTLALGGLVIGIFVRNFPALIGQFNEYWLPVARSF